ncbi:MAG: PilZ domain-containing protein [Gammaproteobacteria bacterium]
MNDKTDIMSVHFEKKAQLYKAYMPYMKQGALFVKTNKSFELNDEVFLLIQLLDETDKFSLQGNVVWVTPTCAQGGKPAGIGVQLLGQEGEMIRNKIEGYLAGMLESDNETDTL